MGEDDATDYGRVVRVCAMDINCSRCNMHIPLGSYCYLPPRAGLFCIHCLAMVSPIMDSHWCVEYSVALPVALAARAEMECDL